MPDGKRKRRHSSDRAKRAWYARYRSLRFARRFLTDADAEPAHNQWRSHCFS
jgi:hypothetical protein